MWLRATEMRHYYCLPSNSASGQTTARTQCSVVKPPSLRNSAYFSSHTFASEAEFHQIADKTLETIENALEEQAEEDVEIQYASGVLAIRLGDHGIWVINKQTPNRQLWWSSPISGPKRYEYVGDGLWAYTRRIGNNKEDQNLVNPSDTLFHIVSKEYQDIYGSILRLEDK